MPKRTYQPHKRQRKVEHGFMKRNANHTGRLVLKRRRLKGRKRLAI
ncbi:50S ribosomal protein L34 [Candidatus Saccharibacteria bacterium]|nr:50S ribosomal protein L34 [Candidatus Saccharibacteria bacterium]MBR3204296.1 50S ribosomal protein L34 [Candidatus Saccharibacteria bacterium]